jgi:hypothetical protein
MSVALIFTALAALFMTMAAIRIGRDRSISHPQPRTWLLIGAIFGAVSAYLFYQG